MSDSRVFNLLNNITAETVAKAVASFLQNKKKLYVECSSTQVGFLVQAKETEGWKNITGLGVATQVQIIPSGDVITVSIGAGKWIDKAGVATIGRIVFSPLIITAAIGAFNQYKLPDEIFDYIEQFIMCGGKTSSVSLAKSHTVTSDQVECPNCHTINASINKFCMACGTKLGKECSNCGETVPQGIKFCPQCGNAMQTKNECPECHAPVKEGQNFCFKCGTHLSL